MLLLTIQIHWVCIKTTLFQVFWHLYTFYKQYEEAENRIVDLEG